jgi:hypothetical protein
MGTDKNSQRVGVAGQGDAEGEEGVGHRQLCNPDLDRTVAKVKA